MPDLPIRVAVISRNHIVRAGLVSLVAQLHERAVVTDAASADSHLGHHDVAIYDLSAGRDPDAYHDLQRLLDEGIQVIGLVYDDEDRATLSEVAGATRHVITLSASPEQLLAVLQSTTPARQQHSGDTVQMGLPAGLSQREFDVLELIGQGLSNREIAKHLYVSENTVKTYIRTAYRKTNVDSRQAAMLWAMEHGLAGGPHQR